MPRAMISYRNLDGQREFAYSIEKMLREAGIDTWLDVNDIPPLSRWEDEIFKGIIGSDYVVLCLSPEYFESETCLFECYIARGYGKTLLPIVLPVEGETDIHIRDLFIQFEETTGLEHLNYLNMAWGKVLGLDESPETMKQRIVSSILTPQPFNMAYDVYFSFKWQKANFATQICDDLNNAGVKSFIHTRHIDIGVDWRRVSWNAGLHSNFHIVVLSPEVADSRYISKEILVSRTKHTIFIPILPEEYMDDEQAKSTIRERFASNKNLAVLNDIQWLSPRKGYDTFIADLITAIKAKIAEMNPE